MEVYNSWVSAAGIPEIQQISVNKVLEMKYKMLGIWCVFKTLFTHFFPLLPIVRVAKQLFKIGPGPTSQIATLAQGKHHLNSNKPNVYLCLLKYPDFVLHLRQTRHLRMWDTLWEANRGMANTELRLPAFSAPSAAAGAAAQAHPLFSWGRDRASQPSSTQLFESGP